MHVIYLIFLFFSFTKAQNPCRIGSVLSVSNDACFAPISVDTFYAAELTCLQMGGHLPSIPNEDVNDQLVEMGKKYFSCNSIWIGFDAREKWLDGSLSTFDNWDPSDHTLLPTCAAVSTEGANLWHYENCSNSRGFICSFKPQTDFGTTAAPMTQCDIADSHENYIGAPNPVNCTIGSSNCVNWNIAVMIALSMKLNNEQAKAKLEDIGNFMKSITTSCRSDDQMFVITPGTPMFGLNCSQTFTKTTSGGVSYVMDNIDPGVARFLTTEPANEVYNMFQSLQHCPYFPMNGQFGGVVMLFTDVGCDEVCEKILVDNQGFIVDNMTASRYSIRFIHMGLDIQETDCFKQVFKRCGDYGKKICSFHSYDNVNSASHESDLRVCDVPESDDNNMGTVWIIISSVLAVLIIIGCVAVRCFFRYKSLKKGNKWSWFVWRSPTDNGNALNDPNLARANPNDYDEVPKEADVWEIAAENLTYSEQDVLGSGAFATVYLGYLKGEIPLAKIQGGAIKLGIRKEPDDSYKVAVKRLPPHATAEGRMDFNHEIEFMKELGYHSHILSLLGVVTSISDSLIVVENCEFGDLLSFVRTRKEHFIMNEEETSNSSQSLRSKDLVSIAWQISDGMSYLGSKNFIHRDIAARNILLSRSMVAKIGDFGLCRLVDSSLYTAKGGRLPIKWMAPESLKYYEYSLKSDVWSFGVLLFELFSLGEAPYGTVQPQDMPKYLDEGNRLPQTDTCPNEIFQIMCKCWQKMPELRPSIDKIRDELTNILNSDSNSYGYLVVQELQEDNDVCEI